MNNIHGTCGNCGGPVTTPMHWGGSVPPVPTCDWCGSAVETPYGDVTLKMKPMPKRQGQVIAEFERLFEGRK